MVEGANDGEKFPLLFPRLEDVRHAFKLPEDVKVNVSHICSFALRSFYWRMVDQKHMRPNGNILAKINAERFVTDYTPRTKGRTVVDAAMEILHADSTKEDVAKYYDIPVLAKAKKA